MDMAIIKIDGNMIDVNEYLRNREKPQKEKNTKDNNLFELDLLK